MSVAPESPTGSSSKKQRNRAFFDSLNNRGYAAIRAAELKSVSEEKLDRVAALEGERREIIVSPGRGGMMGFVIVYDGKQLTTMELEASGTPEAKMFLESDFFDRLTRGTDNVIIYTTAKSLINHPSINSRIFFMYPTEKNIVEMVDLVNDAAKAYRDKIAHKHPTKRQIKEMEKAEKESNQVVTAVNNSHPQAPIPIAVVEEPANDRRVKEGSITLYTDASQSIEREGVATTGWVKPRKTVDGVKERLEFGITITRVFDTNRLEALGILTAILAYPDMATITIYSDSTNGMKLAIEEIARIREGKIINDSFLRGHIRRKDLQDALEGMKVHMRHVYAHAGDTWNGIADRIVKEARFVAADVWKDHAYVEDKTRKNVESWMNRNYI